MAEIILRAEGNYNFTDISNELWRCYIWDADETASEYWIHFPQWLAIIPTGHLVLDNEETSYYVPYGWRMLKWKAAPGELHFLDMRYE